MPHRSHPEAVESGGPQRRTPSRIAVTAAVLALAGGSWLVHEGTRTSAPPLPSASDALSVGGAGGHAAPAPEHASPSAPPSPAPLPFSVPTRVRIPSLRVDAPVMRLGLDAADALQVPPSTDRNMAGWYQGSVTPGQRGSAVLAGHVDTLKGPAVFYNLGSLHKGNTVRITRADGRTAVFTVYGVEVYAKADFPTGRIYDDTPTPELRVITCGGGFSKATRSYLGNVVVYARLTSVA